MRVGQKHLIHNIIPHLKIGHGSPVMQVWVLQRNMWWVKDSVNYPQDCGDFMTYRCPKWRSSLVLSRYRVFILCFCPGDFVPILIGYTGKSLKHISSECGRSPCHVVLAFPSPFQGCHEANSHLLHSLLGYGIFSLPFTPQNGFAEEIRLQCPQHWYMVSDYKCFGDREAHDPSTLSLRPLLNCIGSWS